MKKTMNFLDDFGYNYFGPLLQNFSKWLLTNLRENNIKKVYFLSRDGYIMKRAFDIVNTSNEIKSVYFYASRRSTIVPCLWKLKSPEEIFDVIVFNKKISIKSFFKKVGLDDFNMGNYLKKYSFTLDDYIDINVDDDNFNNLLKDIFPIIKSNSKKEWDCMLNYANRNEFNGKVAIVDIGWYGSMQNSLEKLFSNVKIFGYYFGLVPNKKICIKNSKGFLFDTNKNIDTYTKMHYFINVFEFLFLAQHGSVKRYSTNKFGVDFYDYEYSDCNEKNYAKCIQESAIKYIKGNDEILKDDEAIEKFISFFIKPNYKSAKIFGEIKFNDDELMFIAKPHHIINYIFNFKKFKTDFLASSWRIGFLKRLFVIPLPYFKINNLIRKIFLFDN